MRVVGQRVKSRLRGPIVSTARRALDRVPRVSSRLREGLTIFTFHDVGTGSAFQDRHELSASIEVFERQVAWIESHFEVVHPDVLLDERPLLPRTAALITFDDAWAGTFRRGLPALERRWLPSIVFLNMATVLGEPDVTAALAHLQLTDGKALPTPALLRPGVTDHLRGDPTFREFVGEIANISDLSAWDGHPLVRFGNHLFHHWHCTPLDAATFSAEFGRNTSALDRFASALPFFAFPYGRPRVHFTDEQVSLARSLGARRTFSSEPRRNRVPLPDPLSRISLSARTTTADEMSFLVHRPGS